ncbi:MAG TPA: hypothetical protein VH560_09485 [Polyangia bacterium]|jgi:hypothetical protein|nr:hypothetical protein [Polyangia bacterium]
MRTSHTKTAKPKAAKPKTAKPKAAKPKAAKPKSTKFKIVKAKAKPKAKLAAKAKAKPPRATPAPAKRSRPPAMRASVRVKARERSDDGNAFIRDPGEGPARTRDDLAEVLAEDFIGAATSGNDVLEDDLERETADELGGPFVVTSARVELADDVDESNPIGAEPEALPRAVAGLVARPVEEDEGGCDDEEASSDDHARRSRL